MLITVQLRFFFNYCALQLRDSENSQKSKKRCFRIIKNTSKSSKNWQN